MHLETKCLHAGYTPKNAEPRVLPIVQSTTYVFDSIEEMSAVFDDPTKALIYSRFANPTVMAVEDKIAALEGGLAAMCTSSGQAATMLAVMNICQAGDSFISTQHIYGGSVNLFNVTFKKLGIECIFVPMNATDAELDAAVKPNTKLVFGESLANPVMSVLDIERVAAFAHRHKIPLVVDNTLPTPVFCRPIEYGADIVVHSTSKYMDGHALQVGGVIVDSGNFDWTASGKFPCVVDPDPSYHGLSYTEKYGKAAYILKARMQLMRDFGAYPSAHSGFLLNLGLETLPLRVERHCDNAQAVAEYLSSHEAVESVAFPGLKTDKYHALAQKYLCGRGGGIVSLVVKGGKESAVKFIDKLKLASCEVHLADIRTCVLHPASTTHRQLTDDQLIAAGVNPGMIRLSVGLEHIGDIIEDIRQALA